MKPVTLPSVAKDQVEFWMKSPTLTLLAEGAGHWAALKSLADTGRIVGAKFHDARIAAICLQHGIAELWTADCDFSRFPELKTRNPLVS